MTLKHLVFVYGTLKTGEPNHPVISTTGNAGGQSQLVGPGRTVDTFPLVIASRYNIPYLLDAPEQGQRVRGEVFSEKQLGRQFSIDAAHMEYRTISKNSMVHTVIDQILKVLRWS